MLPDASFTYRAAHIAQWTGACVCRKAAFRVTNKRLAKVANGTDERATRCMRVRMFDHAVAAEV